MYTIRQAASRSGVNVALLRAWERRYGIVAPSRTDAGYRLYDDAAIERLRAMRALVDEGWSPRQAAERVSAADLDELGGLIAGVEATTAEVAAPEDDTTSTFVDGARRIDGEAIERALDDMFARGTFERIVEDRLYPALHALGDAWVAGEVDVAGEHAASAAAIRRLAMAFEAAGSPRADDPPILVGLPPGARHEIAALGFATAARRAGLPVVYLGPDVPATSWVAAANRTGARAAAFGVVLDRDVPAAREVVAALRSAVPGLVVAVGGSHAEDVGNGDVVRLPDRIGDAVEAIGRALEAAG